MRVVLLACILFFSFTLNVESHKAIFAINEQWVCNIKNSCLECLRQSHCCWCLTENKCFSSNLETDGFCKNETVAYKDYGLSIEENAACECAAKSGDDDAEGREAQCRPPGAPDTDPECSGRGVCRCGRCQCATPDTLNPTKVVLGEFCEFDNFSCDGPECDEGPYPLEPPAPDAEAAQPALEAAAADPEPDVPDDSDIAV